MHQVKNLTERAINYLVACLEGHTPHVTPLGSIGWWVPVGDRLHLEYADFTRNHEKAGSIIDRERIDTIYFDSAGEWAAFAGPFDGNSRIHAKCGGQTRMLAAMRAYVTDKLGPEVDVPLKFL